MLLGSQSANCGDRSCHPRPRAARASLQTAPQACCPLCRCLATDQHCARSTQTASRARTRAALQGRLPDAAVPSPPPPAPAHPHPFSPPPTHRRRTPPRAHAPSAAPPSAPHAHARALQRRCRAVQAGVPVTSPLTRASRDLSARRFPPSNTSLSRFASRRRFASRSGSAPLPCLHVTPRFAPPLAPCAPHDRNLFARRQTSSAPRARAGALSVWRPAAPRVPPDGETPPKSVPRKRSRGVARRRKTRGAKRAYERKSAPGSASPRGEAGRPHGACAARARAFVKVAVFCNPNTAARAGADEGVISWPVARRASGCKPSFSGVCVGGSLLR